MPKKKAVTPKPIKEVPPKRVPPTFTVDKRALLKEAFLESFEENADPVEWIERNFGISLYSNQIESVTHLFDKDLSAFNILGARGSGKSHGLAVGLPAFCIRYPGLRVIVAAPKEKQAGRILKEARIMLDSKTCLVTNELDRAKSSAHRLQFRNGSYIIALSGQATANVEGEHGHILVVDEAHKTPSYSVTNKLLPMIGMLEFSKTIKIGVSMGRNHFWKSCVAKAAVVDSCPWYKAEIFQMQKNPIMYNNKPYPRELVARMPVPYKRKYFPDRPDLWKETGQEIPVLDWETQYELLWADDIQNFLSDEDQEALASGKHMYLLRGINGDFYCAGLDTAQGSLTGRKGTDATVLSIWRIAGGIKEKVASFSWVGAPLTQINEIWEIVNPENGLFPCKFVFADYSNFATAVVDMFRDKGVPMAGVHFQATEPRSRKNWKNAIYDHFQVQLQTGKVKYPDMKQLDLMKLDAKPQDKVQIENFQEAFQEWCQLLRIRGNGINDKIEAPTENVEGEDGTSEKGHDDHPTADALCTYAIDHVDELNEMAAKAGDLSGYSIPMGVVGNATATSYMGAKLGSGGEHPIDAIMAKRVAPEGPNNTQSSGPVTNSSYISNILGTPVTGRGY